jgi:hypothetical protein
MNVSLARVVGGAAVAVAALLPVSSADAGEFCSGYLNVYSVNAPGFVNCTIATGGAVVGRVGACTSAYQPLSPPFGTGAVPQTQAYADCLY